MKTSKALGFMVLAAFWVITATYGSDTNPLARANAAGWLQQTINQDQDQEVLARYLGIAPKVRATITADHCAWQVEVFDQYSRNPAAWNRKGAQIRDFSAPWEQITDWRLEAERDDQWGGPLEYLWLTLGTESGKESSLPLTPDTDPVRLQHVLALLTRTPPPRDLPKVVQEPRHPEENQTGTAAMKPDLRTQLEELRSLYDDGLISKQIYEEKQRDILDGL